MLTFADPALIDAALDSRSISFENPKGARGQGGMAAHGRKGSPSRRLAPGETITLADIGGPGRIRRIWMTFPPAAPEQMRAVWMEAYYDGNAEPSISVPCLDFFALPLGRTTAYFSALTSVQEGRGFNAYFPMPFRKRARLALTNSGPKPIEFYFQIDYTLEEFGGGEGYLHVSFRRENPTTLRKDFVIAEGLKGPGRFLGSAVGIRVLQDGMGWYGEGEFKFYRDGDEAWPTICGTGLEDYVGAAWGMHQHTAFYAGAPLYVCAPENKAAGMPDFVGFYRWHVPDPIVFQDTFTATIQQIGAVGIPADRKDMLKKYEAAGNGWQLVDPQSPSEKPFYAGIAERRDDYCAAAFIYCRVPQPVPRLNIKAACAEIGLLPYEKSTPA
ncbi:MAG TPA: glycoside hydrolase family 172 protein [Rhizomicrobium sp.]|nr:glycoside hydrolase family 172 protein [Rhizomicrobium sp.]